ncbi:dTDP-4-dehydrorhamnose reductase [Nocardia sp. XZ_19_385]|uniref:dTDP-4-dehydrorhamnose reductase n=1 Tax=Nocardia sp. XZ_19_385 TaxID=2769488 RepID=UPI0018903EEE|nr:dTDP-4-dehydrorhamnose reductase [Nocardia sp. XZ_19_385]
MTRLVVTGADGLLGSRIASPVSPFQGDTRPVLGYGSKSLDITDWVALKDTISPGDLVINCAAYTDVDAAETESQEAFRVNALGPKLLARACARARARLVHISTAYVFDGATAGQWETGSPVAPLSVYGRSKLAGERAVRAESPDALIVRTMWLYAGIDGDFPARLIRKCSHGEPVAVVNDQIASPTYVVDFVAALFDLVTHPGPPRLLHATNGGSASKYEFAQTILKESGLDVDLVKVCRTADFRDAAARPLNSLLSNSAWINCGLTPLPHWRDGLRRAIEGAGPA